MQTDLVAGYVFFAAALFFLGWAIYDLVPKRRPEYGIIGGVLGSHGIIGAIAARRIGGRLQVLGNSGWMDVSRDLVFRPWTKENALDVACAFRIHKIEHADEFWKWVSQQA